MLISSFGHSADGLVTAAAGEVSARAAWLRLVLLEGEAGIPFTGREDLAEHGERIDEVPCFVKTGHFREPSMPKGGNELLRISAGAAIVVVRSGIEDMAHCSLYICLYVAG